jgi:hypothetical protein
MRPDTLSALQSIITACFVGTWIVLGAVGFLLFYLGKDVVFKRKWFPRNVMLGGLLFVFYSTTLFTLGSGLLGGLGVLVVVVPAVCLISWLNIKFTKFCGECGSTIVDQNWFSPMKFCSKCGAELDAKPNTDSELLE